MISPPTIQGGIRVAVVGLGYVGLPLAIAFAEKYDTMGFDIDAQRVSELNSGYDRTNEVEDGGLAKAARLTLTTDTEQLRSCNVFIVTVPTPIDDYKLPDFTPLLSASGMISKLLKAGDLVIYESTVYPGATEERCIPVLVEGSGLAFNQDFFAGYSPERANPGDRLHNFSNVIKLTSGSNAEAAEAVDQLYKSIIPAGTFKTSSMQVAEAAKVIENTQRDLNIALVNEFAIIFNLLNINTNDVLDAAETKWNFMRYRPGLVGGHCIGVDPYYLTHKAQSVGYQPEVILSGRRINDDMGIYVATQLIKCMLRRRMHVSGSRILILGITFKENCPDIRNTRVVDIISEMESFGAKVDIYDPWVYGHTSSKALNFSLIERPRAGAYDAIIFAVAHDEFKTLTPQQISDWGKPDYVTFDLKNILPPGAATLKL